jgi:hypothetical protein
LKVAPAVIWYVQVNVRDDLGVLSWGKAKANSIDEEDPGHVDVGQAVRGSEGGGGGGVGVLAVRGVEQEEREEERTK